MHHPDQEPPLTCFGVRQLPDGSWLIVTPDGSSVCTRMDVRLFREIESKSEENRTRAEIAET